MINKKEISKEVKETFNYFTKVGTWRPPEVDKVIVHEDLYELRPERNDGHLGNDKCLAIYENGEYDVAEFYLDIFKSKIIAEYTFDEFAAICDGVPAVIHKESDRRNRGL